MVDWITRPIGEIFSFKGKLFEVVEGICKNCNLQLSERLSFQDAANLGACQWFRYDGKSVYFKLIE